MATNYSEEPTNEELKQAIDQIDTKLDALTLAVEKVTALLEELQRDVYALSKE
jgi:hypothetical protein